MTLEINAFVEFLVRVAIGSTLLLCVWGFTRALVRNSSAATRHWIGVLACTGLLLLPVLTPLTPAFQLGLFGGAESLILPELIDVDDMPSLTPEGERSRPLNAPANRAVVSQEWNRTSRAHTQGLPSPRIDSPGEYSQIAERMSPRAESQIPLGTYRTIAITLLIIYLLVVGIGFLRLVLAHLSAIRLATVSSAVTDGALAMIAAECQRGFKIEKRLQLSISDQILIPAITGLWRRRIVLPGRSIRWPADRLRSVLAHELAHIERHDLWIQLLSQIAAILYWPQPLCRVLMKSMHTDRESACDDRALSVCQRPTQYAKHLLDVAENLSQSSTGKHAPAVLAMTRSSVEQRITFILSSTRDRIPPTKRWVVRMLLLFALVLVGISSVSPFTGQSPRSKAEEPKAATKSKEEETKVHTIRGRVLNSDGKPAMDAVVRSQAIGHFLRAQETRTDQQGRYQLKLPAHAYHPPLIAEKGELLGFVQIPVLHDWNVAQKRALRDIQLDAAKCVTLRVTDEKNKPVREAVIVVQSGRGVYQKIRTDQDGTANVNYPTGLPLETIGVIKQEVGCDYRAFESTYQTVDKSHPNKLPQGFEGHLDFVLNGVREASVRLLGPDGEPLKGIRLDPWLIKKPNRGDDWNLPGLDEFAQETNEDGIATFNVVPADQELGISIWPRLERNDWFVIGNGKRFDNGAAIIRWEEGNTATVNVAEKVRVGGRVVRSNGKPAAGIEIAAAGGFYYTNGFNERSESDANGNWEMLVKPNGYYLFVVQDDQFAAVPHSGIVVLEDNAPQHLDFNLEPARRIFGRVTGPVDRRTRVMLQQKARNYYSLPENERLLTPIENKGVSALTQVSQQVTSDGTFEFRVGPGDFVIWSPDQKTQKFSIGDEQEREFNFELARPLRGPLSVRVVNAREATKSIAGASVQGRGTDSLYRGHFDAVTDPSGKLEVERELVGMLLYVRSADGTMKGVTRITAEDREATVSLSPTSTALGRLVDVDGRIMPGVDLEFGIQISYPDGLMSNVTTTKIATDQKGRFKLNGLVAGEEHELRLVTGKNAAGDANSWRRIAAVKPNGLVENLGDVQVPKVGARRGRKTPAELAANAFGADEPLQRRYNRASSEARENGQQLLIVTGSSEDRDSQKFYAALGISDIQSALASFKILPVDVAGDRQPLNRKFLETLFGRKIAPQETELIILDSEQELVAAVTVRALQSGEPTLHQALKAFAIKYSSSKPRVMTVLVRDERDRPLPGVRVFRNHVFEFERDKPHIENKNYTTDELGSTQVELSGRSVDLRLWATLDGYMPLHAMWAKRFQSDGEMVPASFTFELQKGTTIGGTVVDSEGKPIVGAIVEVRDLTAGSFGKPNQPGVRPVRGAELVSRKGAVVTDENGRWSLNNVPSDMQLDMQLDMGRAITADQTLAVRITLPGQSTKREYGRLQREQQITRAALRDQSAKFIVHPDRH